MPLSLRSCHSWPRRSTLGRCHWKVSHLRSTWFELALTLYDKVISVATFSRGYLHTTLKLCQLCARIFRSITFGVELPHSAGNAGTGNSRMGRARCPQIILEDLRTPGSWKGRTCYRNEAFTKGVSGLICANDDDKTHIRNA